MNLPPYLREVSEGIVTDNHELEEQLAIALSQGLTIAKAAEITTIPLTQAQRLARTVDVQLRVAELKQERLARGELVAQDLIAKLTELIHDPNTRDSDILAAINIAKGLFAEFDTRLRVDATIDKVERVYIGVNIAEV